MMPEFPPALQEAVTAFSKLPGIGRRSAERIVLELLQSDRTVIGELTRTLETARDRVKNCSVCGHFTETDPCGICTDPARQKDLLCVVEQPRDILVIEKSGGFKGLYHALMGRIAPLDGIQPEDLRIESLLARVKSNPPREVILALGTDVEGETTAIYVGKILHESGITVTRIAQGISAGMGFEFADPITLTRAFEGRRDF